MTRSEQILEEILTGCGISFKKIPESQISGEKRPDYLVGTEDRPTYWEVKELDENPEERKIINSATGQLSEVYSVDSERVADKLDAAFKQFESYKVTDHPCVIVLYDARSFFTFDFLFEQEISSHLIGNGHYTNNECGESREIHRTKSTLYRRGKHYISGLAVIRRNNELVFYHNPHTTNPLTDCDLLTPIKTQYVASKKENGTTWISSQF